MSEIRRELGVAIKTFTMEIRVKKIGPGIKRNGTENLHQK